MSDGRTLWRAKDCEWSQRERVVALGEEFGPGGPMILDWLEEQAKKQRGDVLSGFRAAARGAFLLGGADEARRIIDFAVDVGALDDFELVDGGRFRCRVSGFAEDQRHGTAAARQQRARSVTERDKSEHDVTDHCKPSHTEQDSREVKTTPLSSESLGSVVARLFAYWQQECHHPTAKLTGDRRRKCEARLREGYTEEQGRRAIDGAARAAFVNDQGKRFDDFELIFRSGSKLESFIERVGTAPTSNGRGPSSRELAARINQDPAT